MLHTGDRVRNKYSDRHKEGVVMGEVRYTSDWYKIVSWDDNPDNPKECPVWALEKINAEAA